MSLLLVFAPLSLGRFLVPLSSSIALVGCSLVLCSTWCLMSLSQDCLSGVLIILTFYLMSLMVYSSKAFLSVKALLYLWVLSFSLFSMFSVSSVIAFYLMFELSLIPMLMIILGWGNQPERVNAGLYMMFYTVVSALPFLVIISSKPDCHFWSFALMEASGFIWATKSILITMPFLVKSPMFFVHVWLPKAHVEAPVYGSMVLAGVLLKIGGYGLWRLSLGLNPMIMSNVGALALTGSGVCSVLTISQVDIKSLIAYSSVVHMGLVIYSLAHSSALGSSGALMMMIAHGITSSGLFCMCTFSYDRVNTRSLIVSRGLMSTLPSLSLLWVMLILMNLSCPPSWNLMSEVLMLLSVVSSHVMLYLAAALILVFGLVFSLYLFTLHYHSFPTPLVSAGTESIRQAMISFSHSQWWLFSPFLFYLFE